ncbi:MAG: YqjF family protein [Actinomycetota bacterium]
MAFDDRSRNTTISPLPPHAVERAAMIQRWSEASFLHWRVDAAALRPLVHPALEVEEFDGTAWVGLIPFRMMMRFPYQPELPLVSRYPETNVRTYVHDRNGRSGLWFLSLDVPRSVVVAAARSMLRLPYAWSRMSTEEIPDGMSYSAERMAPARGARSDVVVSTARAREDDSELARFLTARFRLFGRGPLGLFEVDVEHPPWMLSTAEALSVEDELVAAASMKISGAPDHVLFSPGVDVRLGFPHRL